MYHTGKISVMATASRQFRLYSTQREALRSQISFSVINVPSPSHVVVFPFMAQGHTIPLLDIAKAFANRDLKVTIITTPSNAPFISSKTSYHPNISSSIILFLRAPEHHLPSFNGSARSLRRSHQTNETTVRGSPQRHD